jgi:hypothetical protein
MMPSNISGLAMFRSVGLLVLGLGLCAACGCASVGAGRSTKLTERASWGRSRVEKESVTKNDKSAVVSFRAPRRDPETPADSKDSSFPGHSAELPLVSSGSSDRESLVTRAGYEDESPRTLNSKTDSVEFESGVIDAHYRSDRDASDNPIQLQGLQAISESMDAEDPGGIDEWAQRPKDAPVQQADLDSHVTGVSLTSHQANPPPSPWQAELDQLIVRAERELASLSPRNADTAAEYRRLQVHLRFLYLLARHPEQALTVIPSLDPADQEYWQEMVWAITNSLDPDEQLSPRDRAAHTIPRINNALRRLREQADLSIRNSAFCEEISYYGNYKRFPREEFVPGQPVLLYAEIENFRSEPSTTGEYRTLLRSLVEIVGPNGQIRWKKSFAATEDLCRNPRRDYFHNYQFTIPDRLPLGPHTLRLTVVDELSGKQATSMIKFMVK